MLKILFLLPILSVLGICQAQAQTQLPPKEITVQGTEQFKKGDSGTFSGTITRIDNGRVTVKGDKKTIVFYVKQEKDSTNHLIGFDKAMMEKISKLTVGDKVRIAWVFDLHIRLDSIEKTDKEE
ncbi:MAG TPA: hypothetical protein DCZ94_08095 [Lentisphaeria bacterium]|nr:MAG: hypothetical protein A2X48_19570 [Lentisphaerae bacterium GWF2_49_21]HBC86899.1 hypothetical protein [Lentisphaeria bacterium]